MNKKTLVLTFASFDRPTSGHQKLVDFVKESAKDDKYDSMIFIHGSRNTPAKLMELFPTVGFTHWGNKKDNTMLENFINMFKNINKDYKDIVFVCDRNNVELSEKFFRENNDKHFKFDSINVISSGMDDPDISSQGKQLMLVNNKNRDRYYRKEIFNVGDKVVSKGKLYEVVRRGTNHLLLIEHGGGNLVAEFVKNVKEYKPNKITKAQARKIYESVKKVIGEAKPKDIRSTGDLVNFALEHIQTGDFTTEKLLHLNICLERADKYGVAYDKSLIPEKIMEARKILKNKMCHSCGCMKPCKCGHKKKKEKKIVSDDKVPGVVGKNYPGGNAGRLMRIDQHLGEKEKASNFKDFFQEARKNVDTGASGYIVSADKKRTKDGRMIPARHIKVNRRSPRQDTDKNSIERSDDNISKQQGDGAADGTGIDNTRNRDVNPNSPNNISKRRVQNAKKVRSQFSDGEPPNRGNERTETPQKIDKRGPITFLNQEKELPKFKTFFQENRKIEEVLDGAPIERWIKDFQDSNAPQFEGKSKEKRRQMAIAAFMSRKKKDQ